MKNLLSTCVPEASATAHETNACPPARRPDTPVSSALPEITRGASQPCGAYGARFGVGLGVAVAVGLGAGAAVADGAAAAETALAGEPWVACSSDGCPHPARAAAAISATSDAAAHRLMPSG